MELPDGAVVAETPGCNGCIGMGQAPATGRRSLRTVPRNFPGRSGGGEDQVYLCSPETAAASALTGVINDPRTLDMPYPRITEPDAPSCYDGLLQPPPDGEPTALVKGPAHTPLPDFDPLEDEMELPVLVSAGDDVSTDEIMPAGAEALSLWSSLDGMSSHTFSRLDDSYTDRARDTGPHPVVGGRNYGQGSSREQAALAARHLGLHLVLATIHRPHPPRQPRQLRRPAPDLRRPRRPGPRPARLRTACVGSARGAARRFGRGHGGVRRRPLRRPPRPFAAPGRRADGRGCHRMDAAASERRSVTGALNRVVTTPCQFSFDTW
ncbi:aconitase family protein [Streptomyces sp. NPDC051917]|uniref:aconitase family protein n=1 Tax=Streptomyces sp. NPDC051917 TaxID=3154754 RepID=UPI00344B0724